MILGTAYLGESQLDFNKLSDLQARKHLSNVDWYE